MNTVLLNGYARFTAIREDPLIQWSKSHKKPIFNFLAFTSRFYTELDFYLNGSRIPKHPLLFKNVT